MSGDLKAALQPLIDEAVDERLPGLVDTKLRELVGEIVIAGVPMSLLPEAREHQDAIVRLLREKLER